MDKNPNIKLPLEGLKVLELATHVAVPNTTRLLADWGAEVVKIEGLKGEEWRYMGVVLCTPANDKENPIFTVSNANKKFVSLNLKEKTGKEILKKLVAEADVFVTNIRINALEDMGLSYEEVKKINESIIYFYFSGYGMKGPDCDRPGYDSAAFWARTGALVDWVDPNDLPIRVAGGFGDNASATVAAAGILAAVVGKQTSGKGTFLTSSLFGSAIWYHYIGITTSQPEIGYLNKYPQADVDKTTPFVDCYRCKDDEWILLTIIDYDSKWKLMCELLGMEEYIEDPRFSIRSNAIPHMVELFGILRDKFRQKTRQEWYDIFVANDVVCENLVHFKDVHHDEQAWANNYLENVEFASGNIAAMPRTPIQFGEYEIGPQVPSKPVGSDTRSVLLNIGYTDSDIDDLNSANVIKAV